MPRSQHIYASGARSRRTHTERVHLLKGHDGGANNQRRVRQRPSLRRGHTSALQATGDGTNSLGAKHIAVRYFFSQGMVEGGTIYIHHVQTQDQLADIGTEHLNMQRHREPSDKSGECWGMNVTEDLAIYSGGLYRHQCLQCVTTKSPRAQSFKKGVGAGGFAATEIVVRRRNAPG